MLMLPTQAISPLKVARGFHSLSNIRKYHYAFLESQTSPDKDPVVLWLNGGPGVSLEDFRLFIYAWTFNRGWPSHF